MSVPAANVPYGGGFDEASATQFASELAKLCDQLNSMANYVNDTYSPYSSDEIAAFWAAITPTPPGVEPPPPTDLQLQKSNEFKSWIATVNTMIDAAMAGDVGYQIKKWRNASAFALR